MIGRTGGLLVDRDCFGARRTAFEANDGRGLELLTVFILLCTRRWTDGLTDMGVNGGALLESPSYATGR